MFSWIKNLFSKKTEPLLLTDPIKHEDEVKVTESLPEPAPIKPKIEKPKKKKAPTKKVDAVDFDSMNKTQLLAEAKNRGVKANASLKREELLERLKTSN